MYIYIRIDTNITGLDEVEGEGERENEKNNFCPKKCPKRTFDNEVFCLVGKSESCRSRRVIGERTSNKLCFIC